MRNVFRLVGASVLVLGATLFGLLVATSGIGAESALTTSQQLDRKFRLVASAVDGFRRANNRLPTDAELEAMPGSGTGSYQVRLLPWGSMDCDESPEAYRDVEGDDYVLAIWRGEWLECFAPSKGMSTLALDKDAYFILGTAARDRTMFCLLALGCLALALRLGLGSRNRLFAARQHARTDS